MKERIERKVRASNGPRDEEWEEEYHKISEDPVVDERKLYQPRFPESVGGREIFGIHVLEIAEREGWVLHVTSSTRKEANVFRFG